LIADKNINLDVSQLERAIFLKS